MTSKIIGRLFDVPVAGLELLNERDGTYGPYTRREVIEWSSDFAQSGRAQ